LLRLFFLGVFYRRGSETPALTRADLHSQKTQTGGSETPELTNGACRPKVATFDLLRLFLGGIFLLQLDVMYTKKRGDNSPGASGNCSHFASHTEGTTPQERQATARILRATQRGQLPRSVRQLLAFCEPHRQLLTSICEPQLLFRATLTSSKHLRSFCAPLGWKVHC
jgi:hypothetical protein